MRCFSLVYLRHAPFELAPLLFAKVEVCGKLSDDQDCWLSIVHRLDYSITRVLCRRSKIIALSKCLQRLLLSIQTVYQDEDHRCLVAITEDLLYVEDS